MKVGMITLEKLYEHATIDTEADAIKGNTKSGREYGKKVKELTSTISDQQGFYLWGKYEKNNLWRTIYLGKSGKGKTSSLRARLSEELKDEKSFLWSGPHSKLTDEMLAKRAADLWPNSWDKFKPIFERANRKSGTTHIIWVSSTGISNEDVVKIEADLIETMNPIANYQRPKPVSDLQDKTVEIIKMFKHQIHLGRNDKIFL